ncbi:TetR/AcrR family transcriptional regulator [Lutispora thermophila]|uniref:Transcriptional regulator, TetR family n=1 Tax=Lutispora thermophila DSM 19022 TaxID=1122184 RepID=A0A1M6GE55_9FIRM|nr:TetR/AcrR family transcriptional regulator [Lutispora thermophila]SHJ08194.1 transcriptional regulator, TetR family [Lutispora thermophila DSM 19022]
MRDAIETKARILSVAEDIFSRDGFDGARVDDIAKEAGVNKALIYYYFKSKNEILDTLFSKLIEDAKTMLVKSMESTPDIYENDVYRKLFDMYIRFVSEKRKIIIVAIAESAKTDIPSPIIMELGSLIINAEIETLRKEYEKKGLHFPEDKHELLVMEFFTGLTPFLCYALYKEQWEKQYGVSEKALQDYFYQAFKKTHLMAHLPE